MAEGADGLPVEDPAGVMLSSGIQAPTWDEAWAAAVELATSWACGEAETTPEQRDQRELVMDHMQMMQSLPPPKPKKAPWRIEFQ